MAENKPAIGFIGLGLMGRAFTKRLCDLGYSVAGYDIVADKVKAAAAHGVDPTRSPAELARASEVVLVCVTDTAAVEEAVFGKGGVAEAASPDKVLVDHSTTVVSRTREMAKHLAEAGGMAWVDAPVSGGPPAAEAGRLAIMAGGDDAAIRRIQPVMDDLAKTFTHMGPVGAGQITKMVNQILVLTNYCVLAEALRLAEAGGVEAARIPEALAAGHAGSNLLAALYPRMARRDYAPSGFARQVLKDLDMLHDLAKELRVPTPMASQAATLFRLLVARGYGELDGAAIYKLYDDEKM